MSDLGIYFGPKLISLVESKGRKVVTNIQVMRSAPSAEELLEQKVSDEVKIVAQLKEELRRNKVEAKQAAVGLSGRDLIIRTFELPIMPADELRSAINFEVKKYIPFKVEDLISAFQVQFDKVSRRNLILYIGIKKEVLDKYLSILSQLNIGATAIEYSSFSLLRLIKLAGVSERGVLGVINGDLREEDEVSFMVLEDGFPLFSRDITLGTGSEETTATPEMQAATTLEKLKTEIRISLDYYKRKFPTKNIKNTLIIADRAAYPELEIFIKEMGLAAQFIDVSRFIGKPIAFSLTFIKGYSSSLVKAIKSNLKINLLAAKSRAKVQQEVGPRTEIGVLLAGLNLDRRIIILALFICILPFIFGIYKRVPLQQELKRIIGMRPPVATVSAEATYEELSATDSKYKDKIKKLDELTRKKLYATEVLNVIPKVIPQGVWLQDFTLRKDENRVELNLRGIASLESSDQELETVNKFLTGLRENSTFNKYFLQMSIVSVEQNQMDKAKVTNFVISCRNYKE